MGEFEQKVMSKISRLEEREKSNTYRINSIEGKIEELPKIITLMELMVDTSNKQSKTLDKINKNLTVLNGKVNTLDEKVEDLEKDRKERNIDPSQLLKTIIITGVVGFVAWYFGFK